MDEMERKQRKQRGEERREKERRPVWSESRACLVLSCNGRLESVGSVPDCQVSGGAKPSLDSGLSGQARGLHGGIHGCRRSGPFPWALLGCGWFCAVLCNAQCCERGVQVARETMRWSDQGTSWSRLEGVDTGGRWDSGHQKRVAVVVDWGIGRLRG